MKPAFDELFKKIQEVNDRLIAAFDDPKVLTGNDEMGWKGPELSSSAIKDLRKKDSGGGHVSGGNWLKLTSGTAYLRKKPKSAG